MNSLPTRAGGDCGKGPCKMGGLSAVATTGAPSLTAATVGEAVCGGLVLAPESRALAAPRWVELLPAGVFYGRDGRGPFRLEHPESVVAATRALGLEAGIPIDYDHATDLAAPQGHPAPAAGWIKEIEVRDGAIWGRVEWTERAAAAIEAREYRYLSPVFQYSRESNEVTRLLRAGLTNNPNLYLTAISAAGDEDQEMEEFSNRLRDLLKMDGGASHRALLERVRELCAARADGAVESACASQQADPARYVGVAEFQKVLTELNSLRAERAREKAVLAVDEAIRSGKLVPAQREWAISYCAADMSGFAAFVAKQPAIVGAGVGLDAEPPEGGVSPTLSPSELAICAQLGLSPADYLGRRTGGRDFLGLKSAGSERSQHVQRFSPAGGKE